MIRKITQICFVMLMLFLFAEYAEALTEPTIDSILFLGNLPQSEETLLRGSGLHEGVSIFMVSSNQVKNAVTANLQTYGYLACSVSVSWPEWGAEQNEVRIDVFPGRQSLRGKLNFSGDSILSIDELDELCPIPPGAPISLADTLKFTNSIVNAYANYGYLRANVNLTLGGFLDDSLSLSDYRDIAISLERGNCCYLGSMSVSGLDKVRSVVVLREFEIVSGDPLDMRIMRKGLSSVYSLGLFSNVQIDYNGLADGNDTIDVVIDVTEQDYIEIGIASGYISPEAIFGSVFWTQPNIMGNNQKLKLGSIYTRYISEDNSGDEIEPQAVYEEPWFLSSRWSMQLKTDYYYLQRSHQEERSYGGEIGFSRKFFDVWRFSPGYRIERLRYRSTSEDSTETVQEWINTAEVQAGVTRDTRFPLVNPVQGTWFKIAGSVAGGVVGGNLDFYTLSSEFRLFVPITHRFVLAGRAAGSTVLGYDDNINIPPNDRLYLGGGTTVRGYDFQTLGPIDTDGNPIGGNVMALGNVEARIVIIGGFGAVAFLDAGGVWSDFDQVSTVSTGLGIGVGLRYNTIIGPVRLDYGFAPTWENAVRRGKVYFAIGQAF